MIGIPVSREKEIESFLLKPKNLIAVITVPDLLDPGIKASDWKKAINIILLIFKFINFTFFVFILSEKPNKRPPTTEANPIINKLKL